MNLPDLPASRDEATDLEWRQKTVSELFHLISQPLTGLHCLLEVSLMKKQTAAGYRRDIQTALEATSRLSESVRLARELAEADFPGDVQRINLSEILEQIVGEFVPLLEATHVRLAANIDKEVFVTADPDKVRRNLFYVIDSAVSDLPLGSTLETSLGHRQSVLGYIGPTGGEELKAGPVDGSNAAIQIVGRGFHAIGGNLRCARSEIGRAYWVELPLAE